MTVLSRAFRRLRSILSRSRLEREMEAEMQFHLEMETADQIRTGRSPAEAARQARLDFGGLAQYAEEGRDARGTRGFFDLASDLRYALRVLRRTPAFTLVAVLTLGLGIGANTAIFSVVYAVLLKPLPFPEPERLVSVWDGGHSRAEFVAVRDRVRSLESAAAYMPNWDLTLSGDGEPARVITALVTADFFRVLGVTPTTGRMFAEGEDRAGAEPVVVVSHGLWRDRFGGADVIGRRLEVDGIPRTVIGVAPDGFTFPGAQTQLWVPLDVEPSNSGLFWGGYGHRIIGRLRPGTGADQVAAEVRTLAEALRLENPVWRPTEDYLQNIAVSPLQEQLVQGSRRLLGVLLGAVGLVLLIACANVANLLIVRGTARQRELAVRATLGAGPGRLGRQLLTEALVLALVGGVVAVGLAFAGTGALVRLLPASTPRLDEVHLDGTILAFAGLLSLGTGLLFGLIPAIRLSRVHPNLFLAGGSASAGRAPRRIANLLVSGQVALAVVLAVGAGLLVRSLSRLLAVDPGFDTAVVSARLGPPRESYRDPARRQELADRLLERLQAVPGMQSVALTTQVPFDGTNQVMAMWVDGYTTDPNRLELFEVRRVTPEFFRTLGIPLERGRPFTTADRDGGDAIAIVSASAAARYWSDRDVLGGRLRFPWPGWHTIVGVVGDVRNNELGTEALPTLYIPYAQEPAVPVAVVARTAGDPAAALGAIRASVAHVAPDVPVSDPQTLEGLVARSVAAPRALSLLLVSFGGLALVLGAVGTYGVVAYGVERRTREIAVRMAVGARRGAVVGLVVRDGLRLALVGIAAGLIAAAALTRLLQGLLYEVDPGDPVAFTLAPLILALTVLAACTAPAFRATRIEPTTALKRE